MNEITVKKSPTLTYALHEMGFLPEGAIVCGPPELINKIESDYTLSDFMIRWRQATALFTPNHEDSRDSSRAAISIFKASKTNETENATMRR